MGRRAIATVVVFLGLGSSLIGQTQKPSLLLVTIDTLRADRIEAYGYAAADTPHIDSLAAEGVLFESAFSHSPVTLSSHATLLTGRLPFQHGVRSNSLYQLPEDETTLAEILREAGYRTAAFISAAALDARFQLTQGFSVYDDEVGALRGGQLIAERSASEVMDRAIAWLRKAEDDPFFLWVHLFDPHHPYAPPEPYLSRFTSSPYDGEVAYCDQEIGRLLDELKRMGRKERTLIVLTSDHGESLGEHGEETHGIFVYDSTLKVPLIMSGPGIPKGARDERSPVGLVDVLPTVLDRLGLSTEAALSGRDLFRSEPAEFLYAETYLPRDFYNWSPLRALRSEGYKFIQAPRPELYDLHSDPLETQNLVAERARTTRQIASRLESLLASSESSESTYDPDELLLSRLRSLGYVGMDAPVENDGDAHLPDPKDKIGIVKALDEAIAYFGSGRYELAERKLGEILKSDPENFLATTYLADTLFELSRNEEAIEAYREAIDKGRDTAYYHFRLGILQERLGRYDSAADEFREVVFRNPESAAEVLGRAKALLDRGRVDGALHYLSMLEQQGSGGPALAWVLASAWHAKGEPRRALKALDAGRGDSEENAIVLALRGSLLQELGRTDEALASFEKVLPGITDPKDQRELLKKIATLYGDQGRLERAAEYFERAAAMDPGDFEAHANLAITLARAEKLRAALDPLTRALELRPAEVRLINLKAEIHFRLGELEASRELLRRSLALRPDQPRIAEALAEVERKIAAAASKSR